MARRKPSRTGKPAPRTRSAAGKKRAVTGTVRRAGKKPATSRTRTRRASARPPKSARTVAKRVIAKRAPLKRKASPKPPKAVSRTKATPKPAVAPKRKASAPRSAPKRKAQSPVKMTVTRKPVSDARPLPARKSVRKSPALQRQRRTWDESVIPGPPSSLDLDRTASAARSGRKEMLERFEQHTETSPALTGGDVDADWESAYSVGDEAPGGDNPTPDQDLVDDIGEAVGLVYADNEELEGENKVTERDKHRWELDPASSDDFEDR